MTNLNDTLTASQRRRAERASAYLAAADGSPAALAAYLRVAEDDHLYPFACGWARQTIRELLEVIDDLASREAGQR